MIDELLLLSGNDLPFPEAQLTIHQPRLKEIAYITEKSFWSSCEFLQFDKKLLKDQDKLKLLNQSNFNIILMMIKDKSIEAQQVRLSLMALLTLLFPAYEINITSKAIQLKEHSNETVQIIDQSNFDSFKEILIKMFCLTNKEEKEYNPSGDLAQRIADKIQRGRAKKAQLQPNKKIAILSRYVSILAVGHQKDINDLMNYTVYQLMDEFNRFQLKLHYDTWERYKIAGAKDMKDPQDWLKDIHQDSFQDETLNLS